MGIGIYLDKYIGSSPNTNPQTSQIF